MPFASLGLDASILKAVADQGYTEPTPIQKASIPVIIEGKVPWPGRRGAPGPSRPVTAQTKKPPSGGLLGFTNQVG